MRPNAGKSELIWQVGLGFFSMAAVGLIDNARGPVYPDLLREFALSDSVGALFFLIASSSALLTNLLAFRYILRNGAARTTRIFSLAHVAGLLVIGVASSYGVTLIGAALLGVGFGGLGVSINLLASEGLNGSSRRRALSGTHAMYGLASLLAPLAVSAGYAAGLSWRATLAVLGFAPFAVAALSLLFRAPAPKADLGELALTQVRGRAEPGATAVFATICTLYVVAELALGTRLVLFARRECGWSVDAANWLLSGFYSGMFVGRLGFAIGRFPWGSRAAMMLSASVGLVSFACGLLASPYWLAATGLALSVFYPCAIALINEEQGAGAGYITSWCITIQSVGLIAMQFGLGTLTDAIGLRRALWIGPASLGATLICILSKRRLEAFYSRESTI